MSERRRSDRLFDILVRRPPVAALAAACREAGVEAHLVGGVLRDRLLGLASRDYDSVVAGAGREVAATVAGRLRAHLVHLGGKAFAAYRVVAGEGSVGGDDWVLDVWDREGQPLAADLARRDFTVNSLALALEPSPPTGRRLLDPFGGRADLARRLLRATTAESFVGDPLRVLRLPRLMVQLPGFTADPATLGLARDAAPGLARVAAERVREELALIFRHPEAHRALGLLIVLGVYPGLWLGDPQGAPAPHEERAGRAVAEIERLARRAAAVAATAARTGAVAPAADLYAARWTASFCALGGDAAAVARFRDAGYLTHHLAERVSRLLAEPEIPAGELPRRRFLHRLGPLWTTALAHLGARSGEAATRDRWLAAVAELAALAAADGGRIFDPPRLISGEEVQRWLGIGPGPQVGRALERVRIAQVEGRIATREEARALVLRLV